jgi:hypothetical protein
MPCQQWAQSYCGSFLGSSASAAFLAIQKHDCIVSLASFWRGYFFTICHIQVATEGCSKLGASFRVELLQVTSRLIQLQVEFFVYRRQSFMFVLV